VKDEQTEKETIDSVADTKQGGEIYGRWPWVEPEVWTERMLSALEEGVKGNKWFSLIDKVSSKKALRIAYRKVQQNAGAAGVDGQTTEQFQEEAEAKITKLYEELKRGSYRPQAVKRMWIPKPGTKEKRPLGIPTVTDRVVQGSLRLVLEPIFEKDFAEQSYGFRPERSCKDALRRVSELLRAKYTWVVDADIKGYFDTIPREKLMKKVEEKIADGRVLELLRLYLEQGVMEGMKYWTPERGTPQGAVISPLLSNIYLDELDHEMAARGYQMVRYADDFVILCKTQAEAEQALAYVKEWMKRADLTLHPEKTRIVDAMQKGGFDFLGYHFEREMRWPRKKSIDKFREKIRQKTKRANGNSLDYIVAEINPIIRGWCEYFKHSIANELEKLDSWIRMRLRSILRKRHRGKGRGRGWDHFKWPNVYFEKLGLFSMTAARAAYAQSCKRR
jgi:RNA-directed DNA polymerase